MVRGREGPQARRLARTWLIALAIVIHNVPEGLALGSAVTSSTLDGLVLALAIGLQDIPEGPAVAIPVAATTGSPFKGFLAGLLSGATEAVVAVVPPLLASIAATLQPALIALSAGAMIYVVLHEIALEIHHEERKSGEAP